MVYIRVCPRSSVSKFRNGERLANSDDMATFFCRRILLPALNVLFVLKHPSHTSHNHLALAWARAAPQPSGKDVAMTLSDNTRRALRAYDSFTDFARAPDLLWPPETYERLDDDVAQIMLRAFCYAWAAGQHAAGVYNDAVTDLANDLFDALPTWDAQWLHERKVEWTLSLGVESVLLQSCQSASAPARDSAGLSRPELDAVEDMAYFFQIAPQEATLLLQLGRALGKSVPVQQAERGGAPM